MPIASTLHTCIYNVHVPVVTCVCMYVYSADPGVAAHSTCTYTYVHTMYGCGLLVQYNVFVRVHCRYRIIILLVWYLDC